MVAGEFASRRKERGTSRARIEGRLIEMTVFNGNVRTLGEYSQIEGRLMLTAIAERTYEAGVNWVLYFCGSSGHERKFMNDPSENDLNEFFPWVGGIA
jgi:hypothetical protein